MPPGLRLVSDEDVAAYHELLDHHASRFDGWHEAEYDDLYQEGALVVIEALMARVFPAEEFIVGRMVRWVSKCRARGLSHAPSDSADEEPIGLFTEKPLVDLVAPDSETRVDIELAYQELSDEDRQAVYLCAELGLSLREAAEKLAVSHEEVRRRYRSGLSEMTAFLTETPLD